jgi:predicted nucleic acid-binding protein
VSLVVDAGVATAWYLPHSVSEAASAVLREPEPLIAPALLQLELAAVLLRAVRRGELAARDAVRITEELLPQAVGLVPAPPSIAAVLEVATLHGGSVWDAAYIATALDAGACLVTAYPQQAAAARAAGVREVRLLGG